jgi:hypothetical protein
LIHLHPCLHLLLLALPFETMRHSLHLRVITPCCSGNFSGISIEQVVCSSGDTFITENPADTLRQLISVDMCVHLHSVKDSMHQYTTTRHTIFPAVYCNHQRLIAGLHNICTTI